MAAHCSKQRNFQFYTLGNVPIPQVLCTGDFRYDATQHGWLGERQIHHVYLDNTYLDPGCVFPPRVNVADHIVASLQKRLYSRVYIALDSIGKELLLAAVATKMGVQIYVPPHRLDTIRMCGISLRHFTADETATKIHTCSKRDLATLKRHASEAASVR